MTDTLLDILYEIWRVLGQMSPYLLFGFLIAGVLSVFLSAQWVEKHLGHKGMGPIVKASLFGVPLPLCSCGVIPVATSLRRHGASKGAVASFLLSTPQTGVDSIAVTWSLLGPLFAIYRPLAALVTGIIGGLLVRFFEDNNKPAPQATAVSGTENEPQDSSEAAKPDQDNGSTCTDACCQTTNRSGRLGQALVYGFITLPADIAKSLIIGLVLAGLISALVPDGFFSETFGCGIGSMLLMMLVGIPLYICSTGSVPLAAAMIMKGVCPGAVLVFLITGPATNAATISIIWKVLGRRTTIIYLTTVAGMALLSGLLLNNILGVEHDMAVHQHGQVSAIWQWAERISAIVLLAVLGLSVYLTRKEHDHITEETLPGSEDNRQRWKLTISGMTCSHCAANVTRALEEMPGITSAVVDHHNGSAVITGEKISEATLRQVISELGYTLTAVTGEENA